MYYDYGWKPYVSVAERRRRAEKQKAKLLKGKGAVNPVRCEGRTIAKTFWGKAWCQNLERYSDYENRLPRGRSYLRNGLVVDLQVKPGEVAATVSGSHLYSVKVRLKAVAKARWSAICKDCAGGIDSLVELLQGKFSHAVMERICREGTGLFPSPKEIELSCSCPDWATMCKHVAAVLYGIGVRLDEKPELLFVLREVDGGELIARAGEGIPLSKSVPSSDRVLEGEALSEMFGIEMAGGSADAAPGLMIAAKPAPARSKRKTEAKPKRKPAPSKAKKATSKTPSVAKKRKPGRPLKEAGRKPAPFPGRPASKKKAAVKKAPAKGQGGSKKTEPAAPARPKAGKAKPSAPSAKRK